MAEQAQELSRSFLEALKDVQGGEQMLRVIVNRIDQLLGLDVVDAEQCRNVAERVLSNWPRRRLILPGESGTEL